MNIDDLSDLPNWEDADFIFGGDEEESWKPNPTRDTCKVLYLQWQQIMFLLKGILLPIIELPWDDTIETDMDTDLAREIHGDAYIVGGKIRSSESGNSYVLRMENAATIRKLAQSISSSLLLFERRDMVDNNHIEVIRAEIEQFRLLFIQWVQTFQKDGYPDSWGLFV